MTIKLCAVLVLQGIIGLFQFGLASEDQNAQVHVRVHTDAIIPCNVDVLNTESDDVFLTVTWNKNSGNQNSGSLFLASAQKNNGTLTISYLSESLKSKYLIQSEYELQIKNVEIEDTSDYTCQVIKFTGEDRGAIDERFQNTTSLLVQDVPSAPGRPLMSNLKSRSVSLTWQKSLKENNSPVSGYVVQVRKLSDGWELARNITVGTPTTSITVLELRPYRSYVIRIIAVNNVGRSPPSINSEIFITPSEVPEAPPQNLQATSDKSSNIDIRWDPPEEDKINGLLQGYEILYGVAGKKEIQPLTVEDKEKTSILVHLVKPYTEYFVSVKAINDAGSGPEAVTYVITAEGIPSKPRIIHVYNIMSTSFYVNWEAPKETNGNLIRYELQLTHDKSVRTKIIEGGFNNPMVDYISNLEPYTQYHVSVRAVTNGGAGDYSETYPAITDVTGPGAPSLLNYTIMGPDSVFLTWTPPDRKSIYREVNNYLIYFRDTESYSSKEVTVNGSIRETIVKGLPTNREYKMKIAGATKSLYTMKLDGPSSKTLYVGLFTEPVIIRLHGEENTTATDPSALAQQEQDIATAGIIAGIVCAVLFILLGSLVFIGCRSMTCRKYMYTARNYLAVPTNSNSPPSTVIVVADPAEENKYDEVKIEDFVQHVKDLHANSDDLFSQEFEDINKHTRVDLKADCSNNPENRNKNRYVNITAFDHSRVFLRPINGRLRSNDYINANYVDGFWKSKAYIATQGPLPQTFADFWRMIWEQNSLVIIMITNIMERGRRKCDKYWPDEGIEQHGPITVKHINTFSRSHYTVRLFSLKNNKLKKQFERIVHQFHYTEWPDHGVPDFTLPVLKFVQKSAAASHNPPGQGPIVVHCSAGVGRTGTYILIDSMIQKMKDKGTINVPQFLLHIRKQRNFLVQTEEQYMLIHDALVEYIISGGDTEVTKSELTKYIKKLTDKQDGEKESILDKQYQLVTSFKPKEADKSLALKNFNTDKNRNEDFLPLNVKRVSLPFKPGVEGSNYVNATYLQGYNDTDEFILTQHPLESTVEDFWRMVWDQNSSVILLLSPVDDEEYKRFWPEKDNPIAVDTGNFKLGFREEDEYAHYIVRDFLLESTQDDYILMTRIVSCKEWPRKDQPLHKAFDMVEVVQDLHKQNNIGPIIVVDRYGGIQGSKFCALCALHDQLLHDKAVDVYHLCKLYHTKRPGIIGSKEDYLFLYEALESFYHDQTEKESNSFSHHLHLRGSSKKNGSLPKSPTLSAKIETNV